MEILTLLSLSKDAYYAYIPMKTREKGYRGYGLELQKQVSQQNRTTPVTDKYLCVVVKVLTQDLFIITPYFTDTIKKGEVLWEKK